MWARRIIQFRATTAYPVPVQNYCQRNRATERAEAEYRRADKKNKNRTPPPVKEIPSFSRVGDDGTSIILRGDILPKDNRVFDALGATEELLSFLGLAREHAIQCGHEYTDQLRRIQMTIIDLKLAISRLDGLAFTAMPSSEHIRELEDWINNYSKQLSPPEEHVIPGGGIANAALHVARSVCHKTERTILNFVREGLLDKDAQIYLNRLGDFLFVLSRVATKLDKRSENIYMPFEKDEESL